MGCWERAADFQGILRMSQQSPGLSLNINISAGACHLVASELPSRSALIQGSGFLLARGGMRWKKDDALFEQSELRHLFFALSSRPQA